MKVLFVLHQYLPRHVTGTEQYARSLAHGLQAQGHDVEIFAYEPLIQFEAPDQDWFERDESVEGIPVHRCSVHPRHSANRELGDYENPLAFAIFARWLATRQFDVVHVFHLRNLGLSVLRETRRLSIPTAVHLMDFWFLCPNFLLLHRDGSLCDGPPDRGFGCIACIDPALAAAVESARLRPMLEPIAELPSPGGDLQPTVARRAHALISRKPVLFQELEQVEVLIAPSRFLQRIFEARGIHEGLVRHLPYGLDPTRGALRPEAPRDRSDKKLHIGYIGSITRHKGVHIAVEAVRRSKRKDVVLHVHGDLASHPDYSEQLRTLAAGDPRIVFHGRFEPTQLGDVLCTLDCVTVPSLWYENTPFTVLEALQFGLPVVASDLGGISEVVRDGKNGLLFRAGEVDALTAALEKLARGPALLRKLSRNTDVPTVFSDVAWLQKLYVEMVAAKVPART